MYEILIGCYQRHKFSGGEVKQLSEITIGDMVDTQNKLEEMHTNKMQETEIQNFIKLKKK